MSKKTDIKIRTLIARLCDFSLSDKTYSGPNLIFSSDSEISHNLRIGLEEHIFRAMGLNASDFKVNKYNYNHDGILMGNSYTKEGNLFKIKNVKENDVIKIIDIYSKCTEGGYYCSKVEFILRDDIKEKNILKILSEKAIKKARNDITDIIKSAAEEGIKLEGEGKFTLAAKASRGTGFGGKGEKE